MILNHKVLGPARVSPVNIDGEWYIEIARLEDQTSEPRLVRVDTLSALLSLRYGSGRYSVDKGSK